MIGVVPIYEYRCAACGRVYANLQSSAAAAPSCPGCGGSDARRLLSLVAAPGGRAGAEAAACGEGAAGGCCGGVACGRPN